MTGISEHNACPKCKGQKLVTSDLCQKCRLAVRRKTYRHIASHDRTRAEARRRDAQLYYSSLERWARQGFTSGGYG